MPGLRVSLGGADCAADATNPIAGPLGTVLELLPVFGVELRDSGGDVAHVVGGYLVEEDRSRSAVEVDPPHRAYGVGVDSGAVGCEV